MTVFRFLCVALAGLTGSVLAVEQPTYPLVAYASEFDQLAQHIERSDEYAQREFAYLAISEMLFEHQQAVESALTKRSRTQKAANKRYRWIKATERYIDELSLRLEQVDVAAQIAVFYGPGGTSQIVIDRQPVLVSSLNIRDPKVLEDAIVAAYCTYHDCRFIHSDNRLADTTLSGERHDGSGWSFADGSLVTFVSGDGLHFMFRDLSNRQRKERACVGVIEELRTLVQWLKHTVNDGHPIDWNALEVRSDRVVVNSAGGYIRLPLPSLNESDALVQMALPWVRARVAGKAYQKFFPGSELILAAQLRNTY